MDSAKVNGVELEFEVAGAGEPVLLSSPAVPRGFLPLLTQTGAGRPLPADPVPPAGLGRQRPHPPAGKHRRPRRRRR